MIGFRRVLPSFVLCLLALPACQKKADAPAVPAGLPPLPETAVPTATHDKLEHEPHAGVAPAMPPGHPPIGSPMGGGMPSSGEQATPGNIPFDPHAVVSGQLKLDGKVKGKVAEGDTIYLVARN